MSESIEYKPLADSYVSHSLTFTLIKRVGDACMFGACRDDGTPREWEIFIVNKWPESTIKGKIYAPREAVPSNEEWGTSAWTCCSQEAADFRFSHAIQEAIRRQEARQG